MENYKVSDELVEILLKNEFIEVTEAIYPLHFKRMQENGYSPGAVKRRFIYKLKQNFVDLDYINVIPYFELGAGESRINLSKDEVVSMIAFYKMSQKIQQKFKYYKFSIFSLSLSLKEMDDMPEAYGKAFYTAVKSAYGKVIL